MRADGVGRGGGLDCVCARSAPCRQPSEVAATAMRHQLERSAQISGRIPSASCYYSARGVVNAPGAQAARGRPIAQGCHVRAGKRGPQMKTEHWFYTAGVPRLQGAPSACLPRDAPPLSAMCKAVVVRKAARCWVRGGTGVGCCWKGSWQPGGCSVNS